MKITLSENSKLYAQFSHNLRFLCFFSNPSKKFTCHFLTPLNSKELTFDGPNSNAAALHCLARARPPAIVERREWNSRRIAIHSHCSRAHSTCQRCAHVGSLQVPVFLSYQCPQSHEISASSNIAIVLSFKSYLELNCQLRCGSQRRVHRYRPIDRGGSQRFAGLECLQDGARIAPESTRNCGNCWAIHLHLRLPSRRSSQFIILLEYGVNSTENGLDLV